MMKKRLAAMLTGLFFSVLCGWVYAGPILYLSDGGKAQVDYFEPIGQTFVAEDALVEAGLHPLRH